SLKPICTLSGSLFSFNWYKRNPIDQENDIGLNHFIPLHPILLSDDEVIPPDIFKINILAVNVLSVYVMCCTLGQALEEFLIAIDRNRIIQILQKDISHRSRV